MKFINVFFFLFLFFLSWSATAQLEARARARTHARTQPVEIFYKSDQLVTQAAANTTHNIHNRRTSMSSGLFEPPIPAIQWLPTGALHCTATGFGRIYYTGFCWKLCIYCISYTLIYTRHVEYTSIFQYYIILYYIILYWSWPEADGSIPSPAEVKKDWS